MTGEIKPQNRIFQELKDPRYFQIGYLSIFLFYGILELGWKADIAGFIAIFCFAIGTQMLGAYFITKNYTSWKSALITALGLCMLLKSEHWQILALAAVLAISSKFIFKVKGKHLFNPANFGIIATILLTQEAWISPGQWGSSIVILYFIGAAAIMILFKVGRLDTSFVFLLVFFGLEIGYSQLYLGWEWAVFADKAMNGTILLYAFFMITDPVTTPNHTKGRVIWSILLAVISFLIMQTFFIPSAPIWVLFFLAPITTFLDRKYKAEKFHWLQPKMEQSQTITNNIN